MFNVQLAAYSELTKINMHHTIVTSYLTRVLDPTRFRESIELAAEALKDIEFDAIAVSGNSGVSFGAALAYRMDKALLIVRKQGENNHSPLQVEGTLSAKTYIIVDDGVATGKTWCRVYDGVKHLYESKGCPQPKYVATYLYGMFTFQDGALIIDKQREFMGGRE